MQITVAIEMVLFTPGFKLVNVVFGNFNLILTFQTRITDYLAGL